MNAPFIADHSRIVHDAVRGVLTALYPTVTQSQLFSTERSNTAVSWARHIAMYVMVDRFGINQTLTAQHFGRDRTTVFYAICLVDDHCRDNPATARFIDFVEAEVRLALDRQAAEEDEVDSLPVIAFPGGFNG
jgi:chromosomal replication initiation ATPase DnaA